MNPANALSSLLMLCTLLALPAGARAAPVDAPELAQPGSFAVGLRRLDFDAGSVIDISAVTPVQMLRRLSARVWYPALATPGTAGAARDLVQELQSLPWRPLAGAPLRVSTPSVATPDAAPHPQGRWPVVVMSHGLMGWAGTLSALAEHLASRGYVAVSIEHGDDSPPAAAEPLKAAFYLRPSDQLATLQELQRVQATPGHFLHQRLDLERVALFGYSMGGYGALVSAGARVASDGMAYGYVPHQALSRYTTSATDAAANAATNVSPPVRIAAVVAVAPFGGQRGIGALKAAGLEAVRAPTLLVVGDEDDISGYADGVRSIWDGLRRSNRWLLVYENARHNIGANGMPAGAPNDFRTWSYFEEPVWRRDRIIDINRHFITAFLDHTLRGDASRAVMLQPIKPRANDGAWPEAFGTPATGGYAGPPSGTIDHWTGFQRRWAVGLRLEHRAAQGSP